MVDYAIDRVATLMVRAVCEEALKSHAIAIMVEHETVKALTGDFAMHRGVASYKGDPYSCTISDIQNSLYSEVELDVSVNLKKWAIDKCQDAPGFLTIIPYIPWPNVGRAIVDRSMLSDLTVPNLWNELSVLKDTSAGRYREVYLSLQPRVEWKLSTSGYSEFASFKSEISIDFEMADLRDAAEILARRLYHGDS